MGQVWDYVGECIYLDGQLYETTFGEGRLKANGGGFGYEFQYQDHLGSLRLAFRDSLAAAVNGVYAPPVIVQTNAYLPFGGRAVGLDNEPVGQDLHTFSTKERQDDFGINLHDFEARFSDPTIGNRFLQQDLLAELAYSLTPYRYAFNNPVSYIDPDGLWEQNAAGGWSSSNAQEAQDFINAQKRAKQNGGTYSYFEGDGTDNEAFRMVSEGGKKSLALVFYNSEKSKKIPKLTASDNQDPFITGGLALAGLLAADDVTGIGVLDDPAIPFILAGTAIYAAAQNNIVDKMAREIDRILTKPAGPQGSVYELRVRKAGTYIDVRGNTITLNAGDIWKYGKATNGYDRYSQSELNMMIPGGVKRNIIYNGNDVQIRVFEKYLIYGHYFNHGSLPPGNRIFR